MHFRRVLEAALWTIVGGSAAYGVFCLYEAGGTHFVPEAFAQQQTAAETDGAIVGRADRSYPSGGAVPDGKIIGRVSIPALRLTVPIVEGLSKQDLLRGIGHVPNSATAGGLGNMALAAHRDTFFRPVRSIKPGMAVLVSSSAGTYGYQVDSTEIVTPEQVNILEIGTVPQVTLITCYPFDFIGAAPKRFIVHAHLQSLLPLDASGQ